MPGAHPLTADDYQYPDDPARADAEAAAGALAALIAAGWRSVSDSLDAAAIAALLSAGGWIAVRALVTAESLTETMRPVTTALINLQDDVATREIAAIGESLAEVSTPAAELPSLAPGFVPSAAPLGFDPVAPALIADQQEMASTLIGRFAETAEAVIDENIRQGMTNGSTADEIARTIKATIGLTPRQANAVENFRRLLENGDAAALTRALRDRRFDGSVQRAIDGDALSDQQIDRMVQRYTERSLAYRAKVIADTESLAAANAGRRAAWEQYGERKGLDDADIIRFWQTAGGERTCLVCSAIPLMNPDGVPINEPYATPVGPVMMPPGVHPSCRCSERFMVKSIG